MDGVLVDSFEAWLSVMNAAARHFGHPPIERERFRAVYGQPTANDVATFFPDQTVESVETFYNAHFGEYADRVAALPGAIEVLDALRSKGVLTVVVTNTLGPLARRIADDLGLATDAVVGAGDVALPKPAPDPLLRACKLVGVAPGEALMVGDSAYDRDAASAAGVRFAGIGGIGGDDTLGELAEVLGMAG